MNKLKVALADRSYEILIGKNSLGILPEFLQQKKYSKVIVITDGNVAAQHLSRLDEVLDNYELVVIEPGEQSKSFAGLEKACEEILAKKIDRRSVIIAFGGGVVGDLSGFIAAILLRGIDFIQVPTTLLAMVDSSVGGKTAINSHFGKNLIGSFYQPKLVICDLDFLNSLPMRELRAGYAEVLKYGLIADHDFFLFLQNNYQKVFSRDDNVLQSIVARSCEIKADIVARDERESGDRALLNFGHSFGHIFETETNYSGEMLHGEAVALGMLMEAKMSVNLSLLSEAEFMQILQHIEVCGFNIDPKNIRQNWQEKNLISHLYKDKKNEGEKLTCILLEKIGRAVIKKAVELSEFQRVLSEFL